MKIRLIIALGLVLLMDACKDPIMEKPRKLLPRDQMIDMLVEIHLSQAISQTRRFANEDVARFSESDYYYTILQKFNTADSTFEKSLIYYSGKPKEFEKIYTRVLNRLNEMEQEQAQKNQQPVDIGNSSGK